ncbi:MAG: hypothetical protein KDA31_14320 [Phycisphaerales bacterium]|nr:hypothetical protein [Phycisphaerales bacterium]MCB9835533.1 hypothetical protein [Phycisphaera sp.]
MYDFFGGGFAIIYMAIGIGTLIYTSVLAVIFAHTAKGARHRALRPESEYDVGTTMLAVAFPVAMTLIFPGLYFNGYRLLAIGALLLYTGAVAWNQLNAWRSTKGAKMLVAGSIIIAAASYAAMLYSDTQDGITDFGLGLIYLITAPLLWHVVHGVSLDRDRALYEKTHAPSQCRKCGYSFAGLPELTCPECGWSFSHSTDAAT